MSSLQAPEILKLNEFLTLWLGDDSLEVIDNRSRERKKTKKYCCGLFSKRETVPSRRIDLYSVLNAKICVDNITIVYVDSDCPSNITIDVLQHSIREVERNQAINWTNHLLKRAYGQAQPFKRLKVLINSFCGIAKTRFREHAAPIFEAADCPMNIEETRYRGHAMEIAEKIDLDVYDAVVCCSGDGLPHEVFNGLAKRPDALKALTTMAVAMIPSGSGNAMAWNLFGTDKAALAALGIVKGLKMPLDLVSITQADRHTVSFLSQSLGVLADSDLKTEHLRWMGDHRFIYGVLSTIFQKTTYPCDIAFKGYMGTKHQPKRSDPWIKDVPLDMPPEPGASDSLPLKYGTVLDDIPEDWEMISREKLASFYASNMKVVAKDTNFFPAAQPNDGLLDIMMVDETIGYMGALEAIIKLPQGKCYDLDAVQMLKAPAYRLIPRDKDGDISVDGERYPFEAFQVEVHQGLGRVLSKSSRAYQVSDV